MVASFMMLLCVVKVGFLAVGGGADAAGRTGQGGAARGGGQGLMRSRWQQGGRGARGGAGGRAWGRAGGRGAPGGAGGSWAGEGGRARRQAGHAVPGKRAGQPPARRWG